jgi:molybdenum cofactor biosynthesis enzyme MoaA
LIDLAWTAETGPHLVLEVAQACNITCRGCYKLKAEGVKPFEEILDDIDAALTRRRIHTVSIAGAEPTLHPRLCDVVQALRERKLRTAVISNGLALDDAYLAKLKQAGLDLVMLHVDEGQRRPEFGSDPTPQEVNELREQLTRRAARHGLDTGLSVTLDRDNLQSLPELVRLIVASEHIHFLFATNFVDIHGMMQGDAAEDPRRTTNTEVMQMLREAFGLEPFASTGGSGWLSYFVPVLYGEREPRLLRLQSGAADALLMKLPRLLSGRHMFYSPSRSFPVGTQVAVNQLGRGQLRGCLDWLGGVFSGRERLDAKRMVFDNGPVMGPDGHIGCFEFCPNMTVKDGELVPVCVSDYCESC